LITGIDYAGSGSNFISTHPLIDTVRTECKTDQACSASESTWLKEEEEEEEEEEVDEEEEEEEEEDVPPTERIIVTARRPRVQVDGVYSRGDRALLINFLVPTVDETEVLLDTDSSSSIAAVLRF
jgi:hypothetical protein